MKALLINPKFPKAFFNFRESMKLTGRKALVPPLGLITVAALLPQDWDLRLVDAVAVDVAEDDWNWADVVMITGMIIQRHGVQRLIREAKRRGKRVVVGGPYASTLPEELMEAGADFILKGEAENSIHLLLEALASNKKGIIENPAMPDITLSPIPRFDLLRLEDYEVLALQTSRGCPNNCDFCDIANLNGSRPRYKDPEQIVKELQAAKALGRRTQIFIVDDNFIGNKKRVKEILRRLIEWNRENLNPFSFECQASAELGRDLELIDLMTEANFNTVFVGIESPDDAVLTATHKLQNTRHPLVDSISTIISNGLVVTGSFILGFDGEKKGADRRLIDFVEQTNITIVMLHLLQAMSHTKLGMRLRDEGRLQKYHITGDSIFSKPNFVTERPKEEILEEHRRVILHLYEPNRYLKRAYDCCLTIRPTKRAMALARGKKPPPSYSSPPPLKSQLRNLRAFIKLVWAQGVVPPHRLQFWKGFFGVMKRNPSRLHRYLTYCGMGLDMFRMREIFLKEIETPDDYLEDLAP